MLLEVKEVSKSYSLHEEKKLVVDNVSFSLEEGNITVFLGPNGAGKTTTIKLLDLVAKDRGQVFFKGQEVTSSAIPLLKKTGVLLEGTRNLYWSMSISENFAYWGRYKGLTRKQTVSQGTELLKMFNLENKKDTVVKELSLGMQQIASICCACLGEPELLILDEPTLGLDVKAVDVMKEVLRKLVSQRQMAILITTHEMNFAQAVADQIILLNNGKVLLAGPLASVLADFNLKDTYQLKFSRHLSTQEEAQLAEHGKLALQADSYYFELASVGKIQKLLFTLATLPTTGINREDKTLEDLFRRYIGD